MIDPVEAWLDALTARHVQPFTSAEFLKAVRALSARYVERRAELPRRSATDSAGKRAAFAAYYAPLHFLIVRAILQAIGGETTVQRRLVDLGCGTGSASAAWALTATRAHVLGVDRDAWALEEARWTWQQLGVSGSVRRADLRRNGTALVREAVRDPTHTGILLAWSANEIESGAREVLFRALIDAARSGAAVLIVEPLAGSAVPWWRDAADRWSAVGARADEWAFDMALPPVLERIRTAAGFRAQPLRARSIWHGGAAGRVLRSPHGDESGVG